MATQWLRRACMAAASASFLLLAACGGGETESELNPDRVIVFGDAMADIGQNATGRRYTVNDGTVNNWTVVVANSFGRGLGPVRAGGTSYAHGNSRVALMPGAGNDATARSLVGQVDAFLAASRPGENDLVLVNTGHSDIIVQGRAVIGGTQSEAGAIAAVGAAGTELGKQVRRLVNAGATHVAVAGAYNLGRSIWAKENVREAFLETLSREFNDRFKLEAADLGETVLYIDFAQQINVYEGNPGNYSLGNVTSAVCNSVDAGEGIGTGTGQVDSSDCTTATLIDGNYNAYLFADRVYVTPHAQRNLGDHAINRIRNRW